MKTQKTLRFALVALTTFAVSSSVFAYDFISTQELEAYSQARRNVAPAVVEEAVAQAAPAVEVATYSGMLRNLCNKMVEAGKSAVESVKGYDYKSLISWKNAGIATATVAGSYGLYKLYGYLTSKKASGALPTPKQPNVANNKDVANLSNTVRASNSSIVPTMTRGQVAYSNSHSTQVLKGSKQDAQKPSQSSFPTMTRADVAKQY